VNLVSINGNGDKFIEDTSAQSAFALDDGKERVLNVQYDGSTLKTYLGGELYLTASFGIADFFNGNPVYHGMTAATGTFYSGHYMCFQEPTGSPTSGPTGSPTFGPTGSPTSGPRLVKKSTNENDDDDDDDIFDDDLGEKEKEEKQSGTSLARMLGRACTS